MTITLFCKWRKVCAEAWRRALVNPFNTLFGRLALLTIGLIVLVHGTTQVLVMRELGQIDAAERGQQRVRAE